MGELAFAPPTSSPVVPCPSATGPTSIATVKGASHPSAEPSVLPGDACGTALPPAEGQRVRSPDMPSQGSTTSPSGPLLRRCRPSARCFVWPRGREKRPSPRGYSCQQNHSFHLGMPVRTFPLSKAKGSVARCAAGIRICDVAVDVVGTHSRGVVDPLRGAPSGREAERSVRRRGGIPASQTIHSAWGCPCRRSPP